MAITRRFKKKIQLLNYREELWFSVLKKVLQLGKLYSVNAELDEKTTSFPILKLF